MFDFIKQVLGTGTYSKPEGTVHMVYLELRNPETEVILQLEHTEKGKSGSYISTHNLGERVDIVELDKIIKHMIDIILDVHNQETLSELTKLLKNYNNVTNIQVLEDEPLVEPISQIIDSSDKPLLDIVFDEFTVTIVNSIFNRPLLTQKFVNDLEGNERLVTNLVLAILCVSMDIYVDFELPTVDEILSIDCNYHLEIHDKSYPVINDLALALENKPKQVVVEF